MWMMLAQTVVPVLLSLFQQNRHFTNQLFSSFRSLGCDETEHTITAEGVIHLRLFKQTMTMLPQLSERNPLSFSQKDKMDDQVSIPETASTADDDHVGGLFSATACDVCPHCENHCDEPDCQTCKDSYCQDIGVSWPPCKNSSTQKTFTRCQVRRHNHENSAWLIAGDTIYDATGFLHTHPGGVESILRKAGGASDCTRDFEFHSKGARKLLKNCVVGKLRPCPGDSVSPAAKEVKEWWVFW